MKFNHSLKNPFSRTINWYFWISSMLNLERKTNRYFRLLLAFLGLIVTTFISVDGYSQFYRGSYQEFGKNRMQYEPRDWMHMDFEKFNLYYYGTGKNLAIYSAESTQKNLKELEKFFDYRLQGKIYIMVFNNLEEYRESNIGIEDEDNQNIGGQIHIRGNKLFVYFEGDHDKLDKQIREGLSEILFFQMGYGDNWKEIIKNSALLTIPDWYRDGAIRYAAENWSVETDNYVRDAIIADRFKKFNHLTGDQAAYLGHALWNYIGQIYGQDVIPNIIYMARVSRSVESGFLYVLGVPLDQLISNAREYYKSMYVAEEKFRNIPEDNQVKVRTRKTRTYDNFSIDPEGKYAVFTSDEFSQKKVFLYDVAKEKKKRIKKLGHKLDWIPDENYPIVAWHPNGEILGLVYEKRGEIYLDMYNTKEKKWDKRKFRNLERVLGVSFSDNGKELAVSAIKNGQVDLFSYKLMTNSIQQLTFDIYDDLDPQFLPGGNEIIFTSNRPNDTLSRANSIDDLSYIKENQDVYVFDYENKSDILFRITNTPDISESKPYGYTDGRYSYLSPENGIINRYVAYRDSAISQIDTTVHYRYFATSFPVTDYKRNILSHQVNVASGKVTDLLFYQKKYRFYISDISEFEPLTLVDSIDTEDIIPTTQNSIESNSGSGIQVKDLQVVLKEDSQNPEGYIDINNYKFYTELDNDSKVKHTSSTKENKSPIESSDKISLQLTETDNPSAKSDDAKDSSLPIQQTYRPAFQANSLTTQVDWNFANSLYQRFNGGPFVNPGLGIVAKTGIVDLMEDYKFEGGMRYSVDGDNTEYFFSFFTRKKLIDKKLTFQRLAQRQDNANNNISRTYTQKLSLELKYPFSEVAALRGTFSVRQDESVSIDISDASSLATPNVISYMTGAKLEFIFDNTRSTGLNLYNGTRYKIFAEYYQEINEANSDFVVLGLDYRTYIKIHRDIIWANRFSASTSVGSRKLVYYMGAVDDWIVLNGDQFDYSQNIDNTQGYYFQTIATPMRGFIQNVRNGNSFALFNSEIRWPIFKYFSQRPLKSDFFKNFQIVGFTDIGTAWTGLDPYSEDNSFNTQVINSGGSNVIVRLENRNNPLISSYGFGLRSKLLGYFIRFDYAWGLEDGIFQEPIGHLTLALDF